MFSSDITFGISSVATKFEDFFSRDWVALEGLDFETFRRFVAGKRYIVSKPVDSGHGSGVEKLILISFKTMQCLPILKGKIWG